MKRSLSLVFLAVVLFFGFNSLSFGADFEKAQPNLSVQKEVPQQKKVLPAGQMVPAVSPDFEVRIVSIGTATATNRDPFSGRIEDASGPEEMIPIYVTIPFSVAVRNGGRAAARPIRVSIESEGGMPPAYRTFDFNVAGSMLPSMLYLMSRLRQGQSGFLTARFTAISLPFLYIEATPSMLRCVFGRWLTRSLADIPRLAN